MLRELVIGIGATIVVGWSAIEGYRLHLWTDRYLPDLARFIPQDFGALAGLAVGAWLVLRWWNG